ncbi:MAG: sialate O-acetylesterase [Opitutaceae bacterium]|nr:sialate O-acetylesterase [Opitutaceae bacterium]
MHTSTNPAMHITHSRCDFIKHAIFAAFAFALTLTLALTLALASVSANAAVKPAVIFGDGMVLQRDRPVPVWGEAGPGENITVSFASQTAAATAGADGKWRVTLKPLAASATPATLTITGENTIRFSNVLVGEVWLCSGQSNMDFRLSRAANGDAAVAAANRPLLRLYKIKRAFAAAPAKTLEAAWTSSTPETAAGFSAVAYFFGLELMEKLNVPVGLINPSWGGTGIEPWTAPSGFAKIPALAGIDHAVQAATPGAKLNDELTEKFIAAQKAWLDAAQQAAVAGDAIPIPPAFPGELRPLNTRPEKHQAPTVLYNAMIAPVVPFALRGAIWYQGEHNVADGAVYYDKLNALAASWRDVFQNPDMPLHIVQLAPFKYKHDPRALPELWAAQQRFADDDRRSGIAIINDIGNIKDIHPKEKQTVGHRLALLALNKTHGMKNVACDSPAPASVTFAGGAAIVTFANTRRLETRDRREPDWFELAGAGGAFQPATATIDGASVTVRADGVAAPRAVRFAWSGTAEPNLRDADTGLPVGAFLRGDLPATAPNDLGLPEAAGFQIVYETNPLKNSGPEVTLTADYSAKFAGKKFSRVAYYLETVSSDGKKQYAFAAFDTMTPDLAKIGVPTKKSGARFQQYIANLVVKSNVAGVENGKFDKGNIEFWDCNYSSANKAGVPGASDTAYDFGDAMSPLRSPGYGSMQIHNTAGRQTVLAYNNWKAGAKCDIGIGNNPAGRPDWTFSGSAARLKSARLVILAKFD